MDWGEHSGLIKQTRTVYAQGDRVAFDFYLPEDCALITSICVLADIDKLIQQGNWPQTPAGMFNLRWPLPGDVFFQTPVMLDESWDQNYGPLFIQNPHSIPFGKPSMCLSGSKWNMHPIRIPGTFSHMTGYYKDQFNLRAGSFDPYLVHVYLHYTSQA